MTTKYLTKVEFVVTSVLRREVITAYVCRNKSRNFDIHYLVLLAFVGPRPEGMFVCHLDHNPAHNCLSNLEYNTPSENNYLALTEQHGLNGNHNRRLTAEQVHHSQQPAFKSTTCYTVWS